MSDRADMADDRPAGPTSSLGLTVMAAALALDQIVKAMVKAWLPVGRPIEVLPILSLFRVNNEGVAFSMFSSAGGTILTLVTFAITLIVLAMWWRAREGGRIAAIGFALIVGGALGNLVDRVLYGHVIDFLLLHLGGWTLFIFNVADTALTIGPLMLLVAYLRPVGNRG